ncbi:MAG: transporter substrate-binding domain-containing protein [Desulfobacteraceae bacterium]|nr:transporter substrate-binding domain-containing protein [Desulfobacteraceae bacterium]
MKSLLIGILIFFSCSPQLFAKDKLTWLTLNWPPWMILEGKDQGKGQFDYILREARKNLPQYDHVTEKMNWARFWYEVKNNNNICSPFVLKTAKREEIVYFSIPHTFVLPNAIIMRKTDIKRLGNPDTYSIVELLQDKRFKGYVEKSRSFTAIVDNVLQKHESGSNLTRVAESPESLIKMVATGRVDYTIEYPIVAAYYDKNEQLLNKCREGTILKIGLPSSFLSDLAIAVFGSCFQYDL